MWVIICGAVVAVVQRNKYIKRQYTRLEISGDRHAKSIATYDIYSSFGYFLCILSLYSCIIIIIMSAFALHVPNLYVT